MGLTSVQLPQSGGNLVEMQKARARYARFGVFQFDFERQELWKSASRVGMQGKVLEVLVMLLESPGEMVTRESLRLRLWPTGGYVNSDANVNTAVNKLWRVLGDSPGEPEFVETIPRRGYCFVAKIEYANELACEAAEVRETWALESMEEASPKGKWNFFPRVPSATLLKLGAATLLIAGMFFGAGIVLYAHRPAPRVPQTIVRSVLP
jgi:DNA-binding winged helix-turn-helix (wHTH) protein